MLYDIVPPAIFFLSLGGIMVVLGRVIVRVRKQEFTTRVTVTGKQTASEAADLLRPAGKGIRTITSRTALIAQWVRQMFASLGRLPQTLRAWWAERRHTSPSTTPPASPSTAGEVIAPSLPRVRQWRESLQRTMHASRARVKRGFRRQREPQTSLEPAASQPEVNLTRLFQNKEIPVPTELSPRKSRFRLRRIERRPQPAAVTAAVAAPLATKSEPGTRRLKKKGAAAPSALAQAQQAIDEQKYKHAESILVEYIVKHTKDTTAYILLGQAAIGRQAWDEAMEIFEQVLQWGSTKPAIYANLGHAAYRAGRYTKALQVLQRAHEADPTNLLILEDLLSIARKMDNHGLQHSIEEKLHELDGAPQAV